MPTGVPLSSNCTHVHVGTCIHKQHHAHMSAYPYTAPCTYTQTSVHLQSCIYPYVHVHMSYIHAHIPIHIDSIMQYTHMAQSQYHTLTIRYT